MNSRKLLIAGAVLAAVVLAIAIVIVATNAKQEDVLLDEPLYPGLRDKLPSITKVVIADPLNTLEFGKLDEGWGLSANGDYPVVQNKVEEMMISVAQLTMIEPRTAIADNYSRIGVEGMDAEGTTSKNIQLIDAGGAVLVDLIVGNPKLSRGAGTGAQVYIRKAGDKQSWLAKGQMRINTQFRSFVDPVLFRVPETRPSNMSVDHPGDRKDVELSRARSVGNLEMTNIPENMELKSATALSPLGTAFGFCSFDDVKPVSELFLEGSEPIVTKMQTFDGLDLTLTTYDIGEKRYSLLAAEFDEGRNTAAQSRWEETDGELPENHKPRSADEVREEVDSINAKGEGWAYVIPPSKLTLFTADRDFFLKPSIPMEPAGEEGPMIPFRPDDQEPPATEADPPAVTPAATSETEYP